MWRRLMAVLRRVVWFALASMLFLVGGFVLALWWPDRFALIFMCVGAAITCAVLAMREEQRER